MRISRYSSLLSILGLLLVGSCDLPKHKLRPPDGVPSNAVATGGIDGLHWTVCEKLSTTDFVCDIYRRGDGKKMERGWFRLCLSKSAFSDRTNGGIGDFRGYNIHISAVRYKKEIYFNGFDREFPMEKWNTQETGLDKDCMDLDYRSKN